MLHINWMTDKKDTQDDPVKILTSKDVARMGGLKGGKARAAKLSPERRSEIAKKAAKARWDKKNTN